MWMVRHSETLLADTVLRTDTVVRTDTLTLRTLRLPAQSPAIGSGADRQTQPLATAAWALAASLLLALDIRTIKQRKT